MNSLRPRKVDEKELGLDYRLTSLFGAIKLDNAVRPARPVIDLMALARSRNFNKFHDFNDVSCSFQLYFFLALGLISWHLFICFNLGTNPLALFIKLSI